MFVCDNTVFQDAYLRSRHPNQLHCLALSYCRVWRLSLQDREDQLHQLRDDYQQQLEQLRAQFSSQLEETVERAARESRHELDQLQRDLQNERRVS